MKTSSCKAPQLSLGESSWDFFRLSKSKIAVDISSNTLRAYHQEGLPFYRKGRAIFVSKQELAMFIRQRSSFSPQANTARSRAKETGVVNG